MSDYATNTSVNLTVNGQQAAETLANLKKHALELSEQIARAAAAGDKLTLQKLRKELKDTNRQIKEMESSTMQVDNVLRRLDKATPKELQKRSRRSINSWTIWSEDLRPGTYRLSAYDW